VYAGLAVHSYGPISKATTEFYNDDIEEMFPYNVAKANQLLDDAGYPRGTNDLRFTADMILPSELTALAEVVREQLLQVGIDVNIIPLEHTVFVRQYETAEGGWRNYPLALLTQVNSGDPTLAMIYTHSQFTPEQGGQNAGYYSNATLDDLWDQAVAATPEERPDILLSAQEAFVQDAPYVSLLQNVNVCFWRDEFAGHMTTRPDGGHWDAYGSVQNPVWWTGAAEPSDGGIEIPEEIVELMNLTVNLMYAVIAVEAIVLGVTLVILVRILRKQS
jgi:ABC-type transport system substrate-binding protein